VQFELAFRPPSSNATSLIGSDKRRLSMAGYDSREKRVTESILGGI
jgi:hypothetical protein